VLALAGCVPDEPGEQEETPVATESPSPSAEPSQTAEPQEPEFPELTIACDALIPLQVMYDYNPNVSLLGQFSPSTGSLAAEAVERNGTACQWVHGSSGETIDAAAANVPEPELTTLKNEAVTSSNSVPTYGVEGYFEVDGGVGKVQAFSGEYWIVLESSGFFEPGDAAPLVAAAIAALG
jgi:hypothetical protein